VPYQIDALPITAILIAPHCLEATIELTGAPASIQPPFQLNKQTRTYAEFATIIH
jgi:hypothetical protein